MALQNVLIGGLVHVVKRGGLKGVKIVWNLDHIVHYTRR